MQVNTLPANSTGVPGILRKKLLMMGMFGSQGIEKHKGTGHGYAARSITQVLSELNYACLQCAVVLGINAVEHTFERFDYEDNEKQKNLYPVSMTYEFSLTDVEDGSSVIERFTVFISSVDVDKSAGKLSSYALKEWVFKTFSIPDVGIEDPDFQQAVSRSAQMAATLSKDKNTSEKKTKKTSEKATTTPAKEDTPVDAAPTTKETSNKPSPEKMKRVKELMAKLQVSNLLNPTINSTVKSHLTELGYTDLLGVPASSWDGFLDELDSRVKVALSEAE
jgi:hypothetical protein